MQTPWRSKWFAWQPTSEIISISSETELTKLTKMDSVSPVGSTFGETPITRPSKRDSAPPAWESLTTPEALLEAAIDPLGLGLWLLGRCTCTERWETSIGGLFLDFCRWRVDAGLPVVSRTSFAREINDAGFELKGGFVIGLALNEDYLAQHTP